LAPLSWFARKPLPATNEWGNKDVPGLIGGFRESPQSWRELILDLKRRGAEGSTQAGGSRGGHGVPGRLA